MINLLTLLIAVNCVLLTIVILIQNPKGGGIDSTFGNKNTNQVLGASSSIILIEKITWGLATTLFTLCISAAILVNLAV